MPYVTAVCEQDQMVHACVVVIIILITLVAMVLVSLEKGIGISN